MPLIIYLCSRKTSSEVQKYEAVMHNANAASAVVWSCNGTYACNPHEEARKVQVSTQPYIYLGYFEGILDACTLNFTLLRSAYTRYTSFGIHWEAIMTTYVRSISISVFVFPLVYCQSNRLDCYCFVYCRPGRGCALVAT